MNCENIVQWKELSINAKKHSKQLKKQLDGSETECTRVKTAKRKVERKLDHFQRGMKIYSEK